MKKYKIWESKKKLVEKLKKEKAMYEKKHLVQLERDTEANRLKLAIDGKLHMFASTRVSKITVWSRYIKELSLKIKHVENSGAYKFAKKNAKNRKVGR